MNFTDFSINYAIPCPRRVESNIYIAGFDEKIKGSLVKVWAVQLCIIIFVS